MLPFCRLFLLLIGLLGYSATGFAAQDWARRMFPTTDHDFRVVGRGTTAEYHFEFTNPYKESVRVASVRTSCGCTTPSVTRNLVRSRETAAVVAKLNTDTHIGDKSAVITVVFDEPFYAEVQLSVRGHIRTDVTCSPPEVNFGEVIPGTDKRQDVVITHSGGTNWEILDVRSHCSDLVVALSPAERSPGIVRYRMSVKTKDTLAAGELRERLTLVTNDSRFPTIDLAVTGRVRPALEISPAALNFGTVRIGETVEKRLVVRAERPFAIERIEPGDSRYEVDVPVGEKQLHFVKVRFTATEPIGNRSDEIRISTDLGGGKASACLATVSVQP